MLEKKKEFRKFREDLNEAMSDLLEKYDFSMEQGNIRYNDFEMSFKLTFKDANLDKEKEFAKKTKHFMEMAPEDYGEVFSFNGKTFKIVDLNRSARKYPLIVENTENGKEYKMRLENYLYRKN